MIIVPRCKKFQNTYNLVYVTIVRIHFCYFLCFRLFSLSVHSIGLMAWQRCLHQPWVTPYLHYTRFLPPSLQHQSLYLRDKKWFKWQSLPLWGIWLKQYPCQHENCHLAKVMLVVQSNGGLRLYAGTIHMRTSCNHVCKCHAYSKHHNSRNGPPTTPRQQELLCNDELLCLHFNYR